MIGIQILFATLSITSVVLLVLVARLTEEVRIWRQDARDMRDLWQWEREQAKWLRAQLEDERKRPKEGPYR